MLLCYEALLSVRNVRVVHNGIGQTSFALSTVSDLEIHKFLSNMHQRQPPPIINFSKITVLVACHNGGNSIQGKALAHLKVCSRRQIWLYTTVLVLALNPAINGQPDLFTFV
jgi:hypothetical protein